MNNIYKFSNTVPFWKISYISEDLHSWVTERMIVIYHVRAYCFFYLIKCEPEKDHFDSHIYL